MKIIEGYLTKEDIKQWGDKLCNAYCMPAICIKPYGEAKYKVRIILEKIK